MEKKIPPNGLFENFTKGEEAGSKNDFVSRNGERVPLLSFSGLLMSGKAFGKVTRCKKVNLLKAIQGCEKNENQLLRGIQRKRAPRIKKTRAG